MTESAQVKIGYYVHHHGHGHRARAEAIAHELPDVFTLFGTGLVSGSTFSRCVDLESDIIATGSPEYEVALMKCQSPVLHYAPLGHLGVRERMASIARWIGSERPDLFVVDVSAEVALFVSLMGIPTVYVRLNGHRLDPAHLTAFLNARALLAPFASMLEPPETPEWIRRKTKYFSCLAKPVEMMGTDSKSVLVLIGGGGTAISTDRLIAAARATPDWTWRVAGSINPPLHAPENIQFLGWLNNPVTEVRRATVLVGGAGNWVVDHVISLAKRFICIPEERPFAEQACTAAGLRRAGIAVVAERWPDATQWPDLLADAVSLDTTKLTHLALGSHPAGAAQWLVGIAQLCRSRALEPRAADQRRVHHGTD